MGKNEDLERFLIGLRNELNLDEDKGFKEAKRYIAKHYKANYPKVISIPKCVRLNVLFEKCYAPIYNDNRNEFIRKIANEANKVGFGEKSFEKNKLIKWFQCETLDCADRTVLLNFISKFFEVSDEYWEFDARNRDELEKFIDENRLNESIGDSIKDNDKPLNQLKEVENMLLNRKKLNQIEKEKIDKLAKLNRVDFLNEIEEMKMDDYNSTFVAFIAQLSLKHGEYEKVISILDNNIKRLDNVASVIKAQALSKLKRMEEALEILEVVENNLNDAGRVDTEVISLIAANKKRIAFKENLEEIKSNEVVKKTLISSKEYYTRAYSYDKSDYYPAINIAYIDFILSKNLNDARDKVRDVYKKLINSYDEKENWVDNYKDDYWAIISYIEFMMLMGKYEDAINKLIELTSSDKNFIKLFDMESTKRQVEMFKKYLVQTPNIPQKDLDIFDGFYEELKSFYEKIKN